MPTVIDELVVKLGIDASKFKSDADSVNTIIVKVSNTAIISGKALEETLHKTQESTNRRIRQTVDVGRTSAQQFGKFRAEVAGLFTALATGFGLQKFARDLITTNAATGRLAKSIGTSVEDLNTFQEAAKRNGGSADATAQSLLSLTQQFESFSTGGPAPAVAALRRLHVEWADATGKMKPTLVLMRELNRAVQGMDKPLADSLLAPIIGDQGTRNLIEQTTQAYDGFIARAKSLGVLTEEQAQHAITFKQKLADLEQAFTNLGNVVTDAAIGPISEFVKEVTTWVSSPENQKFISDEVVEGIKSFGGFIKDTIAFIHEWHKTAIALAEYISVMWVSQMLLGLGPVSAMIATITAGFLAIKQAEKFFDPNQYSKNSIFWKFISKEDQLKYPDSPESRKARGEPEVAPDEMNPADPSTWFGSHGKKKATDERKATIRDRLAADLGISKEAASGIVQPLNAESGITGINEVNPTVPGSRGGFGWAQWTGPRRDDFEAYVKAHGLNPTSDEANYGFLTEELRTRYPGVLAQLKRGDITPTEAANVVTRQYIVPGVPGQADFETKVQRHISGAEDISKIDLSKPTASEPYDRNAPIHGVGIDPLKDFWKNNFGPTTPAPAPTPPPKPDPSLSGFNMSPSQRDAAASQKVSSNSSVETNINGPITINTQATDAAGIAKSLDGSLKKYSFVSQANTGLA